MGIRLTNKQIQRFMIYLQELKRWNLAINLTSHQSDEEIIERHFLDSLGGLGAIGPGLQVLDMGTGPGFPGIPLKLLRLDLDLILVESTRKKAAFLHHLIGSLDLEEVRVIGSRVEVLYDDPELEEKMDAVVVRAFARPEEAIRAAAPLIRPGGRLVLYQSPDQLKSLKIDPAWKKDEINYLLPFSQVKRSILVLSKRKGLTESLSLR